VTVVQLLGSGAPAIDLSFDVTFALCVCQV
jgi:hypothetical protein